MVESEVARITHESHTMGVELSSKTNRLFDKCMVCHECSCHSPSALLTPCDDISWLFKDDG